MGPRQGQRGLTYSAAVAMLLRLLSFSACRFPFLWKARVTSPIVTPHLLTVALLIINVIGLALGPLLTGMLSDGLEGRFGEESMRYALLLVTSIILPWAAWHYARAGRTIDADLAKATRHD